MEHSINIIDPKEICFLCIQARTFRRNSRFEVPPYDERRKALGLDRLSDRRGVSRLYFAYDVLKEWISAPAFCEHIAATSPQD